MVTTLIADIGSCHMGNFTECEKACKWLAEKGIRPKVQFCPETNGNIPAKKEWLSDLAKYNCSASVWDEAGYRTVMASGVDWIKFAFSQRKSPFISRAINEFKEIFITTSIMDDPYDSRITQLYTYEINGVPVYPVTATIDHQGLYPERFQGFSSHCIDMFQIVRAHMCHAQILEFHFCMNPDAKCPDSKFALNQENVEALCKMIR